MDIASPTGARLTLTPLSVEGGRMPTLYVRAEVATEDFAGANPTVALELAELDHFAVGVEDLAAERAKMTELRALSPEDFALELRIEHPSIYRQVVVVTATVGRYRYHDLGRGPLLQETCVRFALPADTLPEIAADMRLLAKTRRP